ncbi:MAG: S8/S53 family peptidase, partial [Myxococcota bacterium]
MLRNRVVAVFFLGVLASACTRPIRPPPPPTAGVCGALDEPEDPSTFVQLIEFTGSETQPCIPQNYTFKLPGPGGSIQNFELRRDFLMGNEGRLRAFCKWTLSTSEVWPKLADLRGALRQRKLLYDERSSIKPDYFGMARVGAESGGLGQAHWAFHRHRFLRAVGAFELSDAFPSAFAAAKHGKVGRDRPRLAIIDNAPSSSTPGWTDGLPADAYLDHGVALARVAEELLCERGDTAGPCLADIVSVQALEPHTKGSYRGSLGALAAAIYRAVKEAPNPEKLTINLSLGWVNYLALGGQFGDIYANPAETPSAGAVHEALQYARCHGASVIAAAGNRTGAYDNCLEKDAILPAKWGRHLVTSKICREEFQKPTKLRQETRLVISAGAVADHGQALSLHRENSNPYVVANGMAAIAAQRAFKASGGQPTALMSGTSVSTLVASAGIALLQNSGASAQTSEQLVLSAPMPLQLSKLVAHALPAIPPPPGGWTSPPPWVSPAPLVIVADQKLSIDPSVAPCSFSGASVGVTGLSVAECGELEYPSADQSPFIHEQPNPSGGEMCPGCTMVNNLDTFAMRIAFNTLVSAEGGPSLFVQKTKPTGFENA